MHLYERLSPRFRPKRELGPRGSGTGWGARITSLGTAGFGRPRHVVGARGPKLVGPVHHDASFAPLGRGLHLLPGIDLDRSVSEVSTITAAAGVIGPDHEPKRTASSSAGRRPWRSKRIRRMPNRIEERICVPPEDARGSALAAG